MRSITRKVGLSILGLFVAMAKSWDPPPLPPDGTKETSELFQAVGDALSAWESVEHQIAVIFTVLVAENPPWPPLPDATPAIRAYGSIFSAQARYAMVEAAARPFFYFHPHTEFEERLKKLMKEVNGWNARRNDVAHGRVGGHPQNLNSCVLGPNEYNSRKYSIKYQPAYLYNADQIFDFSRRFYELSNNLSDFFMKFWDWRLGGRLGEHP